jgi:hypothetical protein
MPPFRPNEKQRQSFDDDYTNIADAIKQLTPEDINEQTMLKKRYELWKMAYEHLLKEGSFLGDTEERGPKIFATPWVPSREEDELSYRLVGQTSDDKLQTLIPQVGQVGRYPKVKVEYRLERDLDSIGSYSKEGEVASLGGSSVEDRAEFPLLHNSAVPGAYVPVGRNGHQSIHQPIGVENSYLLEMIEDTLGVAVEGFK